MSLPTLEDWVWVEAMLIQSMIGAISYNVRQVTLSYFDGAWLVSIIVHQDDENDRTEIKDVAEEMSILLEDIKGRISKAAYTNILSSIHISKEPFTLEQSENKRIVFRRKE